MAGNTSLTREYNRIFTIMKDEALEPYLFDNVSTRTSYLYALKQAGAIVKTSGRPHLRFNVLKELPTTAGYSDLDVLSPVRPDPMTSAIYEWKQLQCPIQVSGLDMVKTEDASAPDLLEVFVQAAEISMRDGIGGSSVGLFSSNAETVLTSITGLQSILQTATTTGLVGNINRATLAVWRHQSGNVASAFDTNGLNIMTTLYRNCSRYDETPNLIVLNGSSWDNFLRETTRTFQVQLPFMGPGNEQMIDAGFPNVRFFGATMFYDDACPANFGYFVNTKYLKLYVREGRDAEIGDFIKSREYDDLVTYVLWAGNQCVSNLARQGVLLNSDTY